MPLTSVLSHGARKKKAVVPWRARRWRVELLRDLGKRRRCSSALHAFTRAISAGAFPLALLLKGDGRVKDVFARQDLMFGERLLLFGVLVRRWLGIRFALNLNRLCQVTFRFPVMAEGSREEQAENDQQNDALFRSR
jgi:hypothetical protein